VINVQGAIVPVVSLQTYLGLPAAAVSVSDQLVIVRASGERRVALAVNGTDGVVMCSEEACIHAETIFPHLEGVAGVIKGPDGMIMISDLARLLRFDGEEVLAEALAAAENVT
ncbi:MAG TPA: chemotaxis protein CheW, partial [Geobacteraceae bacterium]